MGSIRSLTIPFKVPLSPQQDLERSVNVFIIDGDDLVLVDTGVKGSENLIFHQVRSMGYRIDKLRKIILTHGHPDHIGAAPEIVASTGCEVMAHPAERQWIEDPQVQKAERPVPGFDRLVSGPVRVDVPIVDGDVIDIRGMPLTVIHTPGHSPGSITLWSPRDRMAITGDAVPVPGDLPIYDDAFATIGSIRRLRGLGIETMLSAWTGPVEGAAVTRRLDEATLMVQTIHRSVVRHAHGPEVTPELLASVLDDIGMPRAAANPMVARTLRSHLAYKYNLTK